MIEMAILEGIQQNYLEFIASAFAVQPIIFTITKFCLTFVINNQMEWINSRSYITEEGIQPSRLKVDPQKQRKVYDNIHGFICFPQEIWNFIDTPQFQRLRNIHQVGTLSFVFPGATQTRFQHCLGTGYLARKYVKILIENHPHLYQVGDPIDPVKTKQNIDQAIFTCTLAGIMHDIGHGPYSHAFDLSVIGSRWKLKEPKKWTHEYASLAIFDYLIQKNNLIIKKQLQERVKQLITGNQHPSMDRKSRPWQFQLISNQLTGIDVDKMDYFRRDSFYLGAKNIYIDFDLLFLESRILQDNGGRYRICYPTKYYEKVIDIYHSRYKLFKNYYLNRISLGIQSMICNILNKMEKHPKFRLLEKCQELTQGKFQGYLKLTDSIINVVDELNVEDESDPKMKRNIEQSQRLLYRIRKRDIYRFVKSSQTFFDEDINDGSENSKTIKKVFDKDNIMKSLLKFHDSLNEDDIFIVQGQVSFGMKHQNPMKLVKFFNKGEEEDKIEDIPPQNFSMLYTKQFVEKYICVYITEDNLQKFGLVRSAFTKYIQDNSLYPGVQSSATPRRSNSNASGNTRNVSVIAQGLPGLGSQ